MTAERQCKSLMMLIPFSQTGRPPVGELCRMHAQLLPCSPIALLGPQFMQYYYRRLPQLGVMSGAVFYADDRAAGFITVTPDSERFMTAAIRRDGLRLAGVLLLALARAPRRIGSFQEVWRIMRSRRQEPPSEGQVGEILSFGLLPEYREASFATQTGISIGHELYDWAMAELGRHPLARIRIIVDRDNLPAQMFYGALGWEMTRGDVPGWRTPSVEMIFTPLRPPVFHQSETPQPPARQSGAPG
jgi:ribosomal protein S18 acetylase RimI-like enzyme